jgi:hypothetical protein
MTFDFPAKIDGRFIELEHAKRTAHEIIVEP